MESHVDSTHRWLSTVAVLLAAAGALFGIVMTFLPASAENPEGVAGGPMFIVFMVVPLLLLAGGLRSKRHALQLVTTAGSLVFGAFLAAVVAGNWSGYTAEQRWFVPLALGPVVALCLVAFWAGVRPRNRARMPLI